MPLHAHVVLAVAGHLEQLPDRRGPVAVAQLEALDLRPAQPGQPVGPQHGGVDRRDGGLAQGERQGHSSSRRWKWCLPRLPP